jgi:hypothetical protein
MIGNRSIPGQFRTKPDKPSSEFRAVAVSGHVPARDADSGGHFAWLSGISPA